MWGAVQARNRGVSRTEGTPGARREPHRARGDQGEADFDIQSSKGLISDAIHSGEGGLAEALRPVFIDYLRKHPDA